MFRVSYDPLGTPLVVVDGPIPEVAPPWALLHGAGGAPTLGYETVWGAVSGNPALGLTWGLVTMWSGPQSREILPGSWDVQASLFDVDSRYLGPLVATRLSDQRWGIEVPEFGPGPRRLALVSVAAKPKHVSRWLRTPALLVVAES